MRNEYHQSSETPKTDEQAQTLKQSIDKNISLNKKQSK